MFCFKHRWFTINFPRFQERFANEDLIICNTKDWLQPRSIVPRFNTSNLYWSLERRWQPSKIFTAWTAYIYVVLMARCCPGKWINTLSWIADQLPPEWAPMVPSFLLHSLPSCYSLHQCCTRVNTGQSSIPDAYVRWLQLQSGQSILDHIHKQHNK
jgi:hypothetical protein